MVYLDPNTSHAAVERLARELGRVVGTQRQVQARLAEKGRIKFEEQNDGTRRYFTKKILVEGTRRRCIWMPRKELVDGQEVPESGKTPETTAQHDRLPF
jgi:hypothetical protein